MIRPSIPFCSFAAGAALALVAAVRPPGAPQDPDDATVLAQNMEIVEDGLRALRRSLRDPAAAADSLATLAACEAAVLACKLERPIKTAGLPEAEREAFVKAFRVEMIGLVSGFLELEKAVLEGQDAEATKAIWDRIKALEDPSHERFTDGDGD